MRSTRGYTLVELLVVVGLLGAALAVGAAAMRSGLPGAQLRGEARLHGGGGAQPLGPAVIR